MNFFVARLVTDPSKRTSAKTATFCRGRYSAAAGHSKAIVYRKVTVYAFPWLRGCHRSSPERSGQSTSEYALRGQYLLLL